MAGLLQSGFVPCGRGVVLVMLGCVPPAHSAPQIVDDTYTEAAPPAACKRTTSVCEVKFSTLPRNRTLIVRNVSCRYEGPADVAIDTAYLGGNGRDTHLTIGSSGLVGDTVVYQINNLVFAPFLGGQAPSVLVGLGREGASELSCTIAGELIP